MTAGQKPIEFRPPRRSRTPWLAILAILLLGAASFLVYRVWLGRQGPSLELASRPISAEQLAAEHGLSVRLIAVTAAGGMIDFRLKLIDAQKAQRFLEDPANLPRLIVADKGKALMMPEGLDDEIEWVDGGILFNFYPNDLGLVEPGTPVIVQFGDLHLEPIEAQ